VVLASASIGGWSRVPQSCEVLEWISVVPGGILGVMRRPFVHGSMLIIATVIAVGIVLSGAAFAKGPSQAVIEGPALGHPIQLRDPSSPTIGPRLASLVQRSGFFDRLWCRNCRSRLARPAGALGPRYTVRYTMTMEGEPSSQIVQYVYPYADPRPATFMPGGQRYWVNGQRTTGGWYVARRGLTQLLIGIGLPPTIPRTAENHAALAAAAGGTSPALMMLIGLGVAVACTAVILVARRRMYRASAT
jgi:hypothetical protein